MAHHDRGALSRRAAQRAIEAALRAQAGTLHYTAQADQEVSLAMAGPPGAESGHRPAAPSLTALAQRAGVRP
jgi:hypothetical protein